MSTGKTVPQITFKYRVRDASIGGDNPFRWQDVTSDEIFRDKKVVVFSPTWRLHSYLQHAAGTWF